MRVLLSAYACEPGKGSEPGVGWNSLRQVARYHDVWVLTRRNNRTAIESVLQGEPMSRVHCICLDLPRWLSFWKKGHRGVRIYYYLWQARAYFVARRLHREVGFHVIHHVTFVNYWIPTFLALLPVPFLWGPVGGGESAAPGFWRYFSFRGKVLEVFRTLARKVGELDPFVRLTARRSILALSTTSETGARLRAIGCRRVEVFSEAGLPAEEIVSLGALPQHDGRPFRVMSNGNLLHWKGTKLGLQAFAVFHARVPSSEYWIAGDGPERERLEEQAQALGVANVVVFWGELPRRDVLQKLAACDVLLHPSLHDSGGWVCLEAMAAGRPVICLDLGGPSLQVTAAAGIKVPARTQSQAIGDLAAALMALAASPERRLAMGAAGRTRVAEYFNWDKKGEFLRQIYESVAAMPNAAKLAGRSELASRGKLAIAPQVRPAGSVHADWKNDQAAPKVE